MRVWFALAAALAAACTPPGETPVARLGDQPVSCAELTRYARNAGQRAGQGRELVEAFAVEHRLADMATEHGIDRERDFQQSWQQARRAVLVTLVAYMFAWWLVGPCQGAVIQFACS